MIWTIASFLLFGGFSFKTHASSQAQAIVTHHGAQCRAFIEGRTNDLHPYFLGMGHHILTAVEHLEIRIPKLRPPTYQFFEEFMTVKAEILANQSKLAGKTIFDRLIEYTSSTHAPTSRPEDFKWLQFRGTVFNPFVHRADLREEANPTLREILVSSQTVLKPIVMDGPRSLEDQLEDVHLTWRALSLLHQISHFVRFKGDYLFEVLPLKWTQATGSTAVFEQGVAFGPTAFHLLQALTSDTPSSHEFLRIWNWKAEEHPDILEKLRALEVAAQPIDSRVHNEPETFLLSNKRFNFGFFPKIYHPVVFDFLHGANVIYDLRKKRFVIVDG